MFGLKHNTWASSTAALVVLVLLVADVKEVSAWSGVRHSRRLLILDTDRGWNARIEGPTLKGKVSDGEAVEVKGRGFQGGQDAPKPAEFNANRQSGRAQDNNRNTRVVNHQRDDGSREHNDSLPLAFVNVLMNAFFP